MMFHSIKCCNTESLDINTYDDNSSEVIYDLCRDDLNEAFARFKDLADRKRDITDRDLEAIVSEQVQQPEARYQLKLVQVSCGSSLSPTATVTLADEDGQEQTMASIGTWPSSHTTLDP